MSQSTRSAGGRASKRALSLVLAATLLLSIGAANVALAQTATPAEEIVPLDPITPDVATETVNPPDEVGEDAEESIAEKIEAAIEEDASEELVDEIAAAGMPIEKVNVDAGPFRIGDTWTCYLEVEIPANPAGPAFNMTVSDRYLDHSGIKVVPGTTTLTSIEGSPTTGASFPGSSEPAYTGTNDEAAYTWTLNSPDNSGSATPYRFRITYDVQYTAVRPDDTQELGPRGDYDLRSRGRINYENPAGTPRVRNSPIVSVGLVQPFLTLEKTSLWLTANMMGGSPPGIDWAPLPGQHFPVTLNITNPIDPSSVTPPSGPPYSWTPGPAYNISIRDLLSPGLEEPLILVAEIQRFGGGGESIMGSGSVDPSPEGMILDFDEDVMLYPGDTMTILYVVFATAASDVDAPWPNLADVDWSTMPGTPEGSRRFDDQTWETMWQHDTDFALSIVRRNPEYQIAIDKRVADDGPHVYKVGDTVEYDVDITNVGTNTIDPPLAITDQYNLDFIDLVSVAPSLPVTPASSPGLMTWPDVLQGASLAPSETVTLRMTFDATNSREVVFNRAFLADLLFVTGPPNNNEDLSGAINDMLFSGSDAIVDPLWYFPEIEATLGIERIAIFDPGELQLEKYADPVQGTIMLPGETITYSVDFGNFGPEMSDARISDMVPAGTDYVPNSITLQTTSTPMPVSDDPNDGPGGISGDEVFVDIPTFSTDDTGTLSFDVTVADLEYSAQGILNVANMTIDDVHAKTSNEVIHPVDPFVITKKGEDVNGGKLVPGDDILWTITLENTGITPTTNVVVKDTVPTHTTYVTDSITGQGADDSGNPSLVWNVGTMQIDETQVMTFKSKVDEGVPNGTTISNQATVQSDQSFLAYSDSVGTSEVGDPTLLQTGQNDWIWLLGALAALVGGGLMLERSRRKIRA